MGSVPMRVAFLAAECEPWAKTGGLADVVDALARALGQIGGGALEVPVDVFLPRYRGIRPPPGGAPRRRISVPDPYALGGTTEVGLVDVAADGYRLRLIDHPPAYDRAGYYTADGADFADNAWRFGLLCRAAFEVLRLEGRPPDVLHIHDWHAAPAALLRDGLAEGPVGAAARLANAAIVLTVHNLAYHGWTPADQLDQLGLAPGPAADAVADAGLDLLGTAIERSELVNTVSPGFAAEALTPAFGMGLDGRLRAKGDRFFGILNGLDTDAWNPATDTVIAATYSRADRSARSASRADLLARVGFDPADAGIVFGMIGRLDPQKGFDLLAAAAPGLIADGARFIVQGSGDPALAAKLRRLAAAQPDRVALLERFDRDMARRIYAGVDAFLMPSRFEPCGTGQMIALRYGSPPIVHGTGGLRDTVVDEYSRPGEGTGIVFEHPTPEGLAWACRVAITMRNAAPTRWEGLVDRGMAVDFDWRTGSAPQYLEAYRRAIAIRRQAGGSSGGPGAGGRRSPRPAGT